MPAKRFFQVIAIVGCGLLSLFISFGNITDYWTNFEFVKHVMLMDTIFPESSIKYRAIQNPFFHHFAYIFIIVTESLMTFFFLRGSFRMYRSINSDQSIFFHAKKDAYIGLTLGIALWFIGFEVIAGEWFGMWQSSAWNGLQSANRIVIFFGLCYIMLAIEKEK